MPRAGRLPRAVRLPRAWRCSQSHSASLLLLLAFGCDLLLHGLESCRSNTLRAGSQRYTCVPPRISTCRLSNDRVNKGGRTKSNTCCTRVSRNWTWRLQLGNEYNSAWRGDSRHLRISREFRRARSETPATSFRDTHRAVSHKDEARCVRSIPARQSDVQSSISYSPTRALHAPHAR